MSLFVVILPIRTCVAAVSSALISAGSSLPPAHHSFSSHSAFRHSVGPALLWLLISLFSLRPFFWRTFFLFSCHLLPVARCLLPAVFCLLRVASRSLVRSGLWHCLVSRHFVRPLFALLYRLPMSPSAFWPAAARSPGDAFVLIDPATALALALVLSLFRITSHPIHFPHLFSAPRCDVQCLSRWSAVWRTRLIAIRRTSRSAWARTQSHGLCGDVRIAPAHHPFHAGTTSHTPSPTSAARAHAACFSRSPFALASARFISLHFDSFATRSLPKGCLPFPAARVFRANFEGVA